MLKEVTVQEDAFSVGSGLQERENIMELKITQASLEPSLLRQLIGEKRRSTNPSTLKEEVIDIPLNSANVQTFLSVDFFNHDSKITDLTEGFNPNYQTVFSFKNKADSFYMKHLDKEAVLVEVFAIPPKTKSDAGVTH
jgi:hypothetical protein